MPIEKKSRYLKPPVESYWLDAKIIHDNQPRPNIWRSREIEGPANFIHYA